MLFVFEREIFSAFEKLKTKKIFVLSFSRIKINFCPQNHEPLNRVRGSEGIREGRGIRAKEGVLLTPSPSTTRFFEFPRIFEEEHEEDDQQADGHLFSWLMKKMAIKELAVMAKNDLLHALLSLIKATFSYQKVFKSLLRRGLLLLKFKNL